jgi:2-polyprenyl-3-methyl-5-hydroxy-6-metoxy-1,4-benzoquinol methylase
MSWLEPILSSPAAYRLLGQIAIFKNDGRATYARQYLKPRQGARVLDLGCGPGDILSVLPDCDYTGVDIEQKYIDAARRRFGARGTFHCGPVEDFVLEARESFDLVMANGVLHHLDDRQADAMLKLAAMAMRKDGRTVTLDPCFVDGQSRVARMLLRLDRGNFVRDEQSYRKIASRQFADVQADITHDLLSFPYTLIIMTLRR